MGFTDAEFNGCNGKSGGAPRLGFPGYCLNNAENGVGGAEGVNAYPAAIHMGASWNRELAYARGMHMGREFRRKGVNIALGPSLGPLGRSPKGGRNWEGPSNDPYLTGVLIHDTTAGMQKYVIANLKHIVGNEQETSRKYPRFLPTPNRNASISSNIDDKTMHELYLWPFMDALRAGGASVMCSYQRVNNSDACQNSKVLNGLLKTELGFQGFVVSDWFMQQSGVASALAGLDMVMPVAPYWTNGNLTNMVQNGSVPMARLDDMVTRILAPWFKIESQAEGGGQPGSGIPANLTRPHQFIDARSPDSKPIILQSAMEGHVLVKNVNKALPFKKPKFISIFGYDASGQLMNTAEVAGFNLWKTGLRNTLQYINGTTFTAAALDLMFGSSMEQTTTGPEIALNGTLFTGGGSGAVVGAIDAPLDAFKRQAYEDDTYLAWDIQTPNPVVNAASEACLVFINAQGSEGWDRRNLSDAYSDNIVKSVASQCNNTMVVIHSVGVRIVDAWFDHPNITAVVLGHLPGQDSGRALVELMYGRQSFSGRLPYTVAKQESDYGALLDPVLPSDDTAFYPQANFTEGLYIDYKHFEKEGVEPRFAFGFGLTYTEFEYSGLQIQIDPIATAARLPPNPDVILQGGVVSLWEEVARVRVTIENVGDVAAKEVAQLYMGIPGGPAKVLRGFEKQLLVPGERGVFEFPLTRRDLSTWNVVEQQWELQRGTYRVAVGKSVVDIQLAGDFEIVDA
ncbi:glycoside hydrolase family 3 protein [Periconia macrospinosa]|uniref:beta-glucosidase n=1 Tax=Periconia macrospinosa TaxID=97972 RepID=A0A2V1D6E0_9PLEO|nr:glycoside hydrolase family 3 protein [Periconia macrospinosa]